MDEQLTATIIPFPARRSDGGDLGRSAERLSTALISLSAALTEQRDALRRWRDALADLQQRVQTDLEEPHRVASRLGHSS